MLDAAKQDAKRRGHALLHCSFVKAIEKLLASCRGGAGDYGAAVVGLPAKHRLVTATEDATVTAAEVEGLAAAFVTGCLNITL